MFIFIESQNEDNKVLCVRFSQQNRTILFIFVLLLKSEKITIQVRVCGYLGSSKHDATNNQFNIHFCVCGFMYLYSAQRLSPQYFVRILIQQ